jgi:hypothetical protein
MSFCDRFTNGEPRHSGYAKLLDFWLKGELHDLIVDE